MRLFGFVISRASNLLKAVRVSEHERIDQLERRLHSLEIYLNVGYMPWSDMPVTRHQSNLPSTEGPKNV